MFFLLSKHQPVGAKEMQYPVPLKKMDDVLIQSSKHGRPDETPQATNKATRLGSTTNENSTNSSNRAHGNNQPAKDNQERRLTPSQNSQPGVPTGLVPGPVYGRVQTNGQSLGLPPLNNNPGQLPVLHHDSGPVPTYHLPQATSGVRNVQSGPPQLGPHAQNVLHTSPPGDSNPIQAPPCVNTANHCGSFPQSDLNPQSAAQTGRQPPCPLPLLHDVRSLIRIYEGIAKLSNTKALELLARATMWHPDVISEIEIALSDQRSAELQSSSGIL